MNALKASLSGLRSALDHAFAEDTASLDGEVRRLGYSLFARSTGHCAVVAIMVRSLYGGDFISTKVHAASHWFNRVPLDGAEFDVDLTGDQFGRAPIAVAPPGELWAPTRLRSVGDVNEETWQRYRLLLSRMTHPPKGTR